MIQILKELLANLEDMSIIIILITQLKIKAYLKLLNYNNVKMW